MYSGVLFWFRNLCINSLHDNVLLIYTCVASPTFFFFLVSSAVKSTSVSTSRLYLCFFPVGCSAILPQLQLLYFHPKVSRISKDSLLQSLLCGKVFVPSMGRDLAAFFSFSFF